VTGGHGPAQHRPRSGLARADVEGGHVHGVDAVELGGAAHGVGAHVGEHQPVTHLQCAGSMGRGLPRLLKKAVGLRGVLGV
jgi:hypothetical protein